MMWPIEKRCQQRDTRAFVAPETVDLLAEKMIGIIADRRMAMTRRYLGESGGTPRLSTGVRVWHGGYGAPTTLRPGQSASIRLASRRSSLEGIGFHVSRDDASEEQVRERYHHPEKHWLRRREDITLVELDGWPGQPGREDLIRVEYWNDNGVGEEVIIAFDDVDPVQEIAWTLKGDLERCVELDDEWCTVHGQHFEDSAHDYRYGECALRRATLAENVKALATLAGATDETREAQ